MKIGGKNAPIALLAGVGIVGAAAYFMLSNRFKGKGHKHATGITPHPAAMRKAMWGGIYEGSYLRDRAIAIADLHYVGENDPRKRVTIA